MRGVEGEARFSAFSSWLFPCVFRLECAPKFLVSRSGFYQELPGSPVISAVRREAGVDDARGSNPQGAKCQPQRHRRVGAPQQSLPAGGGRPSELRSGDPSWRVRISFAQAPGWDVEPRGAGLPGSTAREHGGAPGARRSSGVSQRHRHSAPLRGEETCSVTEADPARART